jgi:hypothetical protein
LEDPTCKKFYGAAFAEAAKQRGEKMDTDLGMRALITPATGDAATAKKLTRTSLRSVHLMRIGKADVTADVEPLEVEKMSQTQLNKLGKASRTKRYSKAKKARKNITTKNRLRRQTKR